MEYRERTSPQYRDRTSLFKDKTLVVTGKHQLSMGVVQCLSDSGIICYYGTFRSPFKCPIIIIRGPLYIVPSCLAETILYRQGRRLRRGLAPTADAAGRHGVRGQGSEGRRAGRQDEEGGRGRHRHGRVPLEVSDVHYSDDRI